MRNTLTQARIGFYALLVVAIGLGIGLVPVVIVLELAQPVSSWDLGNGPIAFFFLLLIPLVVFLAVFIVCNVVGSIVDQVLLPQIKAIQEAVRREWAESDEHMRKKLRFADLRSENKVRIRYEPTSADLIDHPTELFRLNSFNVERYWFDFYRKGRWDAHFEYYDPIKRQWVDTGIYGNL